MSRQKIIIVVSAVICIALVVWFITPNREEKAQAQLDTAYKVEQSGQFDQAISLYNQLVNEYAGTEAAKLAADYIVRVNLYRDRLLVQEVRKYLERIALVLDGYREMMGVVPTSVQQLDGGAYMFDSDYIAEIPPEGFSFYLRFGADSSLYTLFSLKDGADKVIRYDATGKAFTISKVAFEREIGADGLEKITKDRMVFLQPNS